MVFDKNNLHYYKPDVVNLPVGELLAKNNVFGDLLPDLVGDAPNQSQPLKTIKLPLTDNSKDIYHIILKRADGSDKGNKSNENIRGGGEGLDHF